MREGKVFWLAVAIAFVPLAYLFVDLGMSLETLGVIALLSLPSGFAVYWLKKKLGLIE